MIQCIESLTGIFVVKGCWFFNFVSFFNIFSFVQYLKKEKIIPIACMKFWRMLLSLFQLWKVPIFFLIMFQGFKNIGRFFHIIKKFRIYMAAKQILATQAYLTQIEKWPTSYLLSSYLFISCFSLVGRAQPMGHLHLHQTKYLKPAISEHFPKLDVFA